MLRACFRYATPISLTPYFISLFLSACCHVGACATDVAPTDRPQFAREILYRNNNNRAALCHFRRHGNVTRFVAHTRKTQNSHFDEFSRHILPNNSYRPNSRIDFFTQLIPRSFHPKHDVDPFSRYSTAQPAGVTDR